MRYQFQVDGRAAAPVRDEWEDAVSDAVQSGYAVRVDFDSAKLAPDAEIARVQ